MSLISLQQMSVGRRLGLGFSALVLMLLGIATLDGLEFHRMSERLRQIVEVNNQKSAFAYRMLNHMNELAVQARTIALLPDMREMDAELKRLKDAQTHYADAEQALRAATNGAGASATAQERQLIDDISVAAQKTLPLILKAAKDGQEFKSLEAITTLMTEARPHEAVWRTKVAELIALEEALNREAYAQTTAAQTRALAITAIVVVAAVAAGILLGWRITRSVKRPIDRAIRIAERIAKGDLSSNVEVESQDEIGRLLISIRAMQDRLRELVGAIRDSAQSIQQASTEVAHGNQDLSQRTELAAANLQQTAASMEHLTSTVHHSADAAAQAKSFAGSASTVAARGGEVVNQVVTTMDAISSSSKKIADIIGVIDGIAFQTNILALNAAVEAARAGEQGRGFAVVAGEVRLLAQRSADAAREIKLLIGTSVDKVEIGARLVLDAGTTMSEIVASVQRMTNMIAEITTSAAEQSSGIGQINTAVTQLDQMTQQNAALVEQSAAAAGSLKDQAGRLAEMVAAFRLQEEKAAV